MVAEGRSALALSEPGAEIRGALKIQQGLRQGFQVREGQGLDARLLLSRNGPAAAMQLTQGQGSGFRLPEIGRAHV